MVRSTRRALLGTGCVLALPCAPAAAIVGGGDAPAGTYDAVARVVIDDGGGCGGTLIAPSWVLSAGHCASITGGIEGTPVSQPPGGVKVTLGTTRTDGTGGWRYGVDEVTLSPSYLATRGHDVALLHLSMPAGMTPVRIAGASGAGLWRPGVMATIAGFGRTREDGENPVHMQVADVPIVADATCARAYPTTFETTTQLCAGYPQGGTDSCQGDSGGPLFGRDGAGTLKLVGVTSYGEGCARAGRYGIYARVADSALREWIRAVVPEAIDDAATAPAPSHTPATTSAPAGARRLRIVRMRALKAGGVRLTVVVPVSGRLLVRWKAGVTRGSRWATVRAGRRSLRLNVPRRARRVYVRATLTPADGARSSLAAAAVLRVAR